MIPVQAFVIGQLEWVSIEENDGLVVGVMAEVLDISTVPRHRRNQLYKEYSSHRSRYKGKGAWLSLHRTLSANLEIKCLETPKTRTRASSKACASLWRASHRGAAEVADTRLARHVPAHGKHSTGELPQVNSHNPRQDNEELNL